MIIALFDNLLSELSKLETLICGLLDSSTINRISQNLGNGAILVGPNRCWGGLDSDGTAKQAKALKAFDALFEITEFLFSDKPSNIKNKNNNIKRSIKSFVEQKAFYGVPSSIPEAKKTVQDNFADLHSLLDSLKLTGEQGFILIPDVNALIRNPDIHTYGDSIKSDKYTIIITPTVLGELDNLKIIRREEEFRKKVESVINRIKGFRQQGNLLDGVITHKTVTVKMTAKEPRTDEVLSWLDKDIPDDRIIASALEIQRQNLGEKVVLITSDINLQNKSEAARLPYIETPEQKQSTQ